METKACDFLQAKGLKLITKNYCTKMGEIDLIMRDKDVLVFVEVRYRKSNAFGGAAESVNYAKIQRIIRAANSYLLRFNLIHTARCRFDVVAISGELHSPEMTWIPDAFEGVST